MQSFVSVFLLVICSSAMTSFAQQSGKYVKVNSTSGAPVCSTDPPSQVLPTYSDGDLRCGIECMLSSCPYFQSKSSPKQCEFYNQSKSSPKQCEFYNQFPENFQNIPNCTGYQPVLNVPADCSFPFTYNGVIYKGCAPGIGCVTVNRTATKSCSVNTVAGVITDTLNIGSQSVPLQSIFGWIIWMRRTGTTFSWNLGWTSYKNGIGSVGDSNYWLGLEIVYLLTSSSKYRLRIEVSRQSTTSWQSIEYWSFKVGDEATTRYQLNVDGFSGDSSNGMQFVNQPNCLSDKFANGMKFSTPDTNNDLCGGTRCAANIQAGWWMNCCCYFCPTCPISYSSWMDPASSTCSSYRIDNVRMLMKVQ